MTAGRACEGCGAPFEGPGPRCAYCGAGDGAAVPERTETPEEMARRLREGMRQAEELQTRVMGSPFWFIHGAGFILVGAILTATVIGAIVGIPAIFVGLRSWKRGFESSRGR